MEAFLVVGFFKVVLARVYKIITESMDVSLKKRDALGVNFVKPSEILARLFEAIPNIIPFAKNKYPKKGFIVNLL